MMGGFLGAGKTTTLLRLALALQRSGKRVGLITNDQAEGLVDTALAEELDLPVQEITGGCFCCRSDTLVEALERLEADRKPEVFLAEPVGSCTDLVATVTLPLERIYRKGFAMAPYAVLVDPYRAMQTLGVEGETLFSADVNYIYRKQLEEAEVIVTNKVDVISADRLRRLREALEREYPEARVLEAASREGTGLDPLFALLTAERGKPSRVMDVDYERHATGEALLGWVNVQATLKPARKPRAGRPAPSFDGNDWLMALATAVRRKLKAKKVEVAHLKLTLHRDDPGLEEEPVSAGRLAAVQLVRTSDLPEATCLMQREFTAARLTINLRAEGDPDVLLGSSLGALASNLEKTPGLAMEGLRSESFRPSKPVPVHRVAEIAR